MRGDLTGVIRSLQATTVNRSRERIEEAALRARDLSAKKNDPDDAEGEEAGDQEFGIFVL